MGKIQKLKILINNEEVPFYFSEKLLLYNLDPSKYGLLDVVKEDDSVVEKIPVSLTKTQNQEEPLVRNSNNFSVICGLSEVKELRIHR